jgi:protein SCO1
MTSDRSAKPAKQLINSSVTAVLPILAALSIAGCSHDTAVDARRFQLTGVVVGREASPQRVVVAHDAVDGLMPSMSMAFDIRGVAPPVRDGDRIAATLVVTDSRSWLEDVTVRSRDGAAATRLPAASRAMPGAIVPDLPLVDQDGAPMTLRSGDGRVRVVTFIYTRCPLPDLCPLMVKHLEALRRRANEEELGSRLALLGVTMDPSFDTPPVLHSYGEAVLKGSNRFDQWTLATGTAAQVENVARFFGVGYRAEGGFVTHTLTTAVVSHDGRVMRVFGSNSWRPDDVYDVVQRGIERAVVQ